MPDVERTSCLPVTPERAPSAAYAQAVSDLVRAGAPGELRERLADLRPESRRGLLAAFIEAKTVAREKLHGVRRLQLAGR